MVHWDHSASSIELREHWFGKWLIVCSVPSHYLNQCWLNVNQTLKNKLRWKLEPNIKVSLDNAVGNIVFKTSAILLSPQCVKHNQRNNWSSTHYLDSIYPLDIPYTPRYPTYHSIMFTRYDHVDIKQKAAADVPMLLSGLQHPEWASPGCSDGVRETHWWSRTVINRMLQHDCSH